MTLKGKVAAITGGNSGIGLAIAQRFKKEGAKLALFARDLDKLEQVKSELGDEVLIVAGDVANLADLDRFYLEIKNTYGHLDILVANAGIGTRKIIEEVTEEHFDNLMNINLKGVFFSMQKALPIIKDGGSMIIISSIAANSVSKSTTKTSGIYQASKAGVNRFKDSFTREFTPTRNLRINSISPGFTRTPIFGKIEGVDENYFKNLSTKIPVKRFASPDEIANVALFLVSDQASYIYGEEIVVDGAYTKVVMSSD